MTLVKVIDYAAFGLTVEAFTNDEGEERLRYTDPHGRVYIRKPSDPIPHVAAPGRVPAERVARYPTTPPRRA